MVCGHWMWQWCPCPHPRSTFRRGLRHREEWGMPTQIGKRRWGEGGGHITCAITDRLIATFDAHNVGLGRGGGLEPPKHFSGALTAN